MFAVLRQTIVLLVVAAASIVFWETSDLRTRLLQMDRAPAQPAGDQPAPPPPVEQLPASRSLVPGSAGQRFVAWALFVLLLPVVSAPVAARVFQQESNTANLVLLFGYTGLDVLAAWLVGGIQIGGLLSGIAYLMALLAVFMYNAWVCGLLIKLQQE